MSDDNVYEFHDNEHSTFDIPEDGTTETISEANSKEVVEKQEEEQFPEDDEEYDPSSTATPVQKDDEQGDNLYDSVDEDEEEKKIESQSNSQHSNEETEQPEPVKELDENTEETKEESGKKEEKEEHKQEQNQDEEDEEEDEEDDDYDPTADVSTKDEEGKPQVTSSSASAAQTSSSITTPTTQASSLAAASLPTNSTSTDLQQSVAKIMSSNLLSDPEFLKLSPTEQQKKILSVVQESNNSTSNQPPISHFASSNSNHNSYQPKDHRPDLSLPMTIDEISRYNAYLDGEAKYATTRPTPAPNSRLFVGNLPANVNTKQDLFRLFGGYGNILQISIKGSYCFIQYSDSQSVERAIQAEQGIPFNGKDLVLEIAKNSRPGQSNNHHQNHQATSNDRLYNNNSNGQDRKRGRDDFDGGDRNVRRRRNGAPLECQIFVKRTADPHYAREVARQFQSSNIGTEYEFLKPGMDLSAKINDVAYNGVMSVVLINKNRNCDVQVYEKTPDGSIRYDEYLSVNSDDATQLLLRAKNKQGGSSNSYNSAGSSHNNSYGSRNNYNSQQYEPSYNQQQQLNNFYQPPPPQQQQQVPQQQNLLQSLQNLPPSALQNLIALAQGQQAIPQQQPAYQQPAYQQQFQPQQQALGGSSQVDLASLLGKVQAQSQQPLQQQYGNQGGFNPLRNGGDSYQPSYQQGAPQQQAPPSQNSGSNVQSLLDTLAKLQK